MDNLDKIKGPIAGAFLQFGKEFDHALQSEIHTIQTAIEKIHLSGGKHIRPLLLLLTAEACGGVSQVSVQSAVILELLHTASLIHDDVVDEAKQRRGVASMNALYDNRIAVLVGDFVLAEALIRAVDTGNSQVVKIIALLSREMAEGEIKQLENINELLLKEKDYFIALEKKTAMLLASCTEIGAITANISPELQSKCKQFGQLLGSCFQIKDDLFDYFDNSEIGKPSGNDIREGKVTLPLIHALATTSAPERGRFIDMLSAQEIPAENVAALIQFAKAHGGIEYAEARMMEYKKKADEIIIQSLPDSDAKNSLLLLSDYIVERIK